MHKPLQKILYGPPGSGKSTRVRRIADQRGINKSHIIETAFHPDYSYGDFVAKIMPTTLWRKEPAGHTSSVIRYQIHVGPFIKALAQALKSKDEVLLVIDEINRGNSPSIFGDIFQLLDRCDDGKSIYGITLSELVLSALMKEFGWSECEDGTWLNGPKEPIRLSDHTGMDDELKTLLDFLGNNGAGTGKLQIPANLSILATMNTSDESVYVMDTAFKRRWDFEFIPWDYESSSAENRFQSDAEIRLSDSTMLCTWHTFLQKLNFFIAKNAPGTRLEDKLIGLWFIKASPPSRIRSALNALKDSTDNFDYHVTQPFLDEIESQRKKVVIPAERAIFNDLAEKLQKFLRLCTPFTSWEKAYAASTAWNDLHAHLFPGPKRLPNDALWKLNNNVKTPERWDFNASPYPLNRQDFIANRGKFLSAIIDLYLQDDLPPSGTTETCVISDDALQYKLLHFVWDSIFYREKTRLSALIKVDIEQLRTFDSFLSKKDDFLKAIYAQY